MPNARNLRIFGEFERVIGEIIADLWWCAWCFEVIFKGKRKLRLFVYVCVSSCFNVGGVLIVNGCMRG